MTTTTIEGSVRVGDAPAPGAEVLWVPPEMDRLLATATTGPGGGCSCGGRSAGCSKMGAMVVTVVGRPAKG